MQGANPPDSHIFRILQQVFEIISFCQRKGIKTMGASLSLFKKVTKSFNRHPIFTSLQDNLQQN
jgi:hypothetical protein